MNRNELVEFLRDPSSLSSENLEELEKIAKEAPYFQSARMLLAKGSKMLNDPSAKKRVATAAIYATDRALLKKYISGKLLFLTNPPEQKTAKTQTAKDRVAEEVPKETSRFGPPREKYQFPKPKESKEPEPEPDDIAGKIVIPGIPEGALDGILEELEQDMEDLKSSRMKFADLQQQIEEEDAVSAALEKATAVSSNQESKPTESSSQKEDEVAEEQPTPPDSETSKEEEETADEQPASLDTTETSEKQESIAEVHEIEDEEEKEEIADDEDFSKHEVISNFTDDDEFDDEPDDLVVADFKTDEEEEEIPIPKPAKKEKAKESKKEVESKEAEKIAKKDSAIEIESKEEEAIEETAAESSSQLKEDLNKEVEKEPEPNSDEIVPPVRLESEIKREERRERRANREKRLSDVNELSESSLKKLEDQMWGDSDDEPEDEAEKGAEKPVAPSSKKEASINEDAPKKETSKKETSTPKKPQKSTAKSTKETAKKKATTTSKATIKKASGAKSSATKSTSKAKKTTTTKKKDEDDGKDHPARDQEQIIDKFIKESPSISKPSDRTKADKDLSDQSSAWNKDVASEYLAEIYLQQGNKKRAIEIYHTLSLNFPEKKSYFADLISKIK